MRIFTCTPKDFEGGEAFFSRDSGLLCCGLESLGVESRVVMPGAARTGDAEKVIRAEFADLESVEWWRGHKLDGVVLYSWGRPKFRKVAAAISEAGVTLILNQDSGGVVSPLNGLGVWLKQQWHQTGQGNGILPWIRLARNVAKGLTLGLMITDPLRKAHLKRGSWIACVSPQAAQHYERLCGIYGGKELREQVVELPHPVESRFIYKGEKKLPRIVCVGRWVDEMQKRPLLMMRVMERLLSEEKVELEIIGDATEDLKRWHGALSEEIRDRVKLRGRMRRESLPQAFAQAQIFYSPSAHESFGIAAGEALCAGCTLVAANLVSMGSFKWFTEGGCGTLAETDDVAGHVAALRTELQKWRDRKPEPESISKLWRAQLHDCEVAKKVVKLITVGKDDKRIAHHN